MKNFVIFGATGDLSKHYLIPSLYALFKQGHLFNYLGYGRSQLTIAEFQKQVFEITHDDQFTSLFHYYSGSYTPDDFTKIAGLLTPDSIYYLALPTSLPIIKDVITSLLAHHLFVKNTSRLIVEKPFGENESSARELITLLDTKIGDQSVFLVDHYLTKELVKNIISLRFANPIFDHLWNGKYIEKINITATEKRGIDARSQYYDHIGAIRDMVQNHCLQLLALTVMNRPASITFSDFVAEKNMVFNHLKLFSDFNSSVKTGQYRDYKKEIGVDPSSTTETFASLTLKYDVPEWQDVPITITTGKKMDQKLTEIEVVFRSDKKSLWGEQCHLLPNNKLIVNLFPDNNIKVIINSEFDIHKNLPKPSILMVGAVDPQLISANAYQNVILDIVEGNQLNTPSFSEIINQWKIVDAIVDHPDFAKNLKIY